MGIFSNDTITLYNKSLDEETGYEVYIPIVLAGVNLVETKGANISNSGMSDANACKLFVDFSLVKNQTKTFVDAKTYQTLEDKTNYFTFSDEGDFFVKGDKSSTVITKTAFYETMHENYEGVYKITTIDIYEDVMPHFEIGGK